MSPESPTFPYQIQQFELPGIPNINSNKILRRKTPLCLDNTGFLKHRKSNFSYDKINVDVIKHTGKPITLSNDRSLKTNDYYLDLSLNECSDLGEAISSLKQLAQFVQKNPEIKWLVGSTWLGSIANGRVVGRFGFHQTNISVPNIIYRCSKEIGQSKKDMNPMYYETISKSTVVFIYAQRDEFLSKFRV
ncbi:MAG: hypothetical protein KIH89_004685 [Candidatus Shapirobacteria bacterium]|nr:hypothetical protein [Candidatus Shapirobacteria bacterium]